MIDRFRDHAANERTFLARVRTMIAIVGFGFGFGVARLGGNSDVPAWGTLALIGSGAAVIALAFVRMRVLRSRIMAEDRETEDVAPVDVLLFGMIFAFAVLLAVFAPHLR